MGIVFGDIGTSPLYTLKVCLGSPVRTGSLDDVLGICSLLFWTLVVVVCLKYVTFIMRVDHEGEGGILALLALASPPRRSARRSSAPSLTVIVIIGGSMMMGDGVITPAISVISAVEGIGIASSALQPYVVPISLGVIVGAVRAAARRDGARRQALRAGHARVVHRDRRARRTRDRRATRKCSCARSALCAALRRRTTASAASRSWAASCSPSPASRRSTPTSRTSAAARSSTGWYVLVFPSLMLNYFGQGANLLADPSPIVNPFYSLAPGGRSSRWSSWRPRRPSSPRRRSSRERSR